MIYFFVVILCICVLLAFLYLHRRNEGNVEVLSMEDAADLSQQEAAQAPVVSEESNDDLNEPEVDSEDEKLVTQNKELVANLHKVLEEDNVFLRPDIHIDDVARMLLTNRTYVTRLMRQEYGLSFIEYVNVARIQYSQKLLYTTNMTLDEIAEKSGFQSTSNYCRAFKRYIGNSPMSWLQTVK